MNKDKIAKIIEFAKQCVKGEEEFKKESFSAIVTGLILKENIDSDRTLEPSENYKATSDKKKISIKEFVIEKQPSTNPEKILCFGYYEEKYRDKQSWTVKDMVNCYKEAKESIPKNPSDQIAKCRSKAWITSSGEGYYLTNTGEKKIEEGFSN